VDAAHHDRGHRPEPEPGVETARPFTITARHDTLSANAGGTFRQRTSAAAISAIRLRIEPPNLRVHDATRGHMRVVADNRSGTRPARVWLTGTDHEGTAQIKFSAPHLDVLAGHEAVVDAEIRAPRPPAGTEHRRDFTITASDGQHEVAADATFAQTASDRRPRLRTLFTVLGGMVMILGAFLPWTTDPARRSGVQWTVPALTGLFNSPGPKLVVNTPHAPSSPLYSQGIRSGPFVFVFVSGTVGVDPRTGALAGETIGEQTRQALANCEAVLHAAGANLDDVTEVGVLLIDPDDFAGMNEEYARWFPTDPPARYAAKLGASLPGLLVSIRMTAIIDVAASRS
jgi:2-iminobutanoate/2-iminopropanoate deaminase